MQTSLRIRANVQTALSTLAPCAFLLVGCAQLRGAGADGRPPELSYTLTLQPGTPPALGVEIAAAGATDGRTVFAFNEEWGGVKADDRLVTDLRVTGRDGRELAFEHPTAHQWVVRHEPGEPLVFRYVLRQPTDRAPAQHANDYRPIITERLFHVIGNHGLAAPEHLQDEKPRAIRLTWQGFAEAGWTVVSSHGPAAETVDTHMPVEQFRHAIFLAGDVRLHQRDIRGRKIGVALHGEWSFPDEDFVALVERIVAMEREFFTDFSDPWFLVSIIPSGPNDPRSLSLGGTGLTQAFAFFASPHASLVPGQPGAREMPRVLAHEYFHHWNGSGVEFTDPEGAAYWFTEGFTDFYARRLMLRAGMITQDEYVESLNDSIEKFSLSPARSAPNARIVAEFWNDRSLGELPYRRGDLVALVLDHHIRERSGGKRSLDDLIRDLLARNRGERRPLSNQALFDRFAREAGTHVAGAIRRCVIDGADLALPARLHEPELVQSPRRAAAFDLGFDLEASRAAKSVQGVRPGGPAEQAGLRDGQALLGMSVHHGQADREAEFTVDDAGARRQIRYLPQGPALEITSFQPPESEEGKKG